MKDENPWNEEIRSLVESPFRLRFELGGESRLNVNQVVPRFFQAFDRARHVAEAVFADSAIVSACNRKPGKFISSADDAASKTAKMFSTFCLRSGRIAATSPRSKNRFNPRLAKTP